MGSIESRVAALVADFSPVVDQLETAAVHHLAAWFGCDAAYVATVGPQFVDKSPPYMQRILADPGYFDPGQRKAREIVARFGPAFVDTDAYTLDERDRLPVFRELLRPAGISSVVLALVHIGARTTGMVHLVRTGTPFRTEALVAAKPLLHALSVIHQAALGRPDPEVERAVERLAPLTPREREVARLAGDGHAASQVAARLGTSVHTVRRQLEAIYRKCAIGNRAELASLVQRASRSSAHPGLARILDSVQMRSAA